MNGKSRHQISRATRLGALASVFVFLQTGVLSSRGNEPAANFRVNVISTMDKLRPEQMPGPDAATRVELFAARGESESSQLIVSAPTKELQQVEVKAAPLLNPDGASIELEVRFVGYVTIENPSPDGYNEPGDYPDPLFPLKKFDVKPRQSQSIWITAQVPADAKPGVYTGNITISTGNAGTVEVPMSLKVYSVVLPRQSALLTVFGYGPWAFSQPEYYGSGWLGSDKEKAFLKQMLDYRMNPANTSTESLFPSLKTVFQKDAAGKWTANWTEFDQEVEQRFREGWNFVQLCYLPIGYMEKGSDRVLKDQRFGAIEYSKDDQAQILRLINDHLVEKGWTRHFGIKAFDEPSIIKENVVKLKDLEELIHRNAPDLRVMMITTDTRERDLAKNYPYYIWVPHLPSLHLDPGYEKFLKTRQKAGDQAWFYICQTRSQVKEGHPYADAGVIDRTGTSQRSFGLMAWKNGYDGFLYWNVAEFKHQGGVYNVNNVAQGDGVLFYPDETEQDIPYPSMRAALLRDGLEDFDLLKLLSDRIKAPGKFGESMEVKSAREKARRVLDVSELIPNLRDFNRKPESYERQHQKVLEALESLEPVDRGKKS